jgi:metallo-beta-lactamase family protein
MTSLTFLGAIDTVTGSRYLIESGASRVLIDCGLFQGPKKLRERNWREPRELASLDAVVLTHAHIDHSGYLPRICKADYRGPVYCTIGTRDLLSLLLPDAGYLQEEEAHHANKWGYARHRPALPLYTRRDAERCLEQLVPVPYDRDFDVAPGIRARFTRAGHIVGSACVAVRTAETSIGFSGDVGRPADPIMRPPAPGPDTQYFVVESTYGDRTHAPDNGSDLLARVIVQTVERQGVLVVPAFAVGRTQHLLHFIAQLRRDNRIPACPVYLDSPMAIEATTRFGRHGDDHALTAEECQQMQSVAQYVRTADESKAIDRSSGPKIIVAASGMCTGGRVLHHLQRFLPDERSTILLVGFQAAGTRGRTLLDGANELKLLGQYVPVRAQIVRLDGLSAHADSVELIDWLRASRIHPRQVFVTHGEPAASDAFRRKVRDELGWAARVPESGEKVQL